MSKLKPIYKFNGGRGATLCNTCRKIITESLSEDLYCSNCGGASPKYELVRQRDGLTKTGNKASWIEWDTETGAGKKIHDEPAIGRSLVLDLTGPVTFNWMTTSAAEIIEASSEKIEFKTKNSHYILTIKNETED